jgi:hypothetical protein
VLRASSALYAYLKREVKGLYGQCFQMAFDVAGRPVADESKQLAQLHRIASIKTLKTTDPGCCTMTAEPNPSFAASLWANSPFSLKSHGALQAVPLGPLQVDIATQIFTVTLKGFRLVLIMLSLSRIHAPRYVRKDGGGADWVGAPPGRRRGRLRPSDRDGIHTAAIVIDSATIQSHLAAQGHYVTVTVCMDQSCCSPVPSVN